MKGITVKYFKKGDKEPDALKSQREKSGKNEYKLLNALSNLLTFYI